MKMIKENKKKKTIVIIILILLLIIVGLTIYLTLFSNNNNDNQTELSKEQDLSTDQVTEYEYSIKNTPEKDGIQATNIKLHVIGNQIEVVTTLKNNTNELLNGYYIEIELLDKNNNTITTIADNSTEKVEAGQSKEILNNVIDIEQPDKVSSAKIVTLEKSNIEDTMEQNFDNMIPKEINTQ